MARCPKCNQALESTALVAAFNDPPGWAFWGEPGARGIVCQGPDYVHFRVTINGRRYHRLATIVPNMATPEPQPAPALETTEALPLFNMVTRSNGEDWL